METMKFSTTAKCMGCIANINRQLSTLLQEGEWEIDPTTKELTIKAEIAPKKIEEAVAACGLSATRIK